MSARQCPACGESLAGGEDRCGSCGLPLKAHAGARAEAQRLAWRACRALSEGKWQDAVSLAEESLAWMPGDNDLAALALMAAVLCGGRTRLREIPRPRGEHLPPALQDLLPRLLRAWEVIHQALQGGRLSGEDASLVRSLVQARRAARWPVPAGRRIGGGGLAWKAAIFVIGALAGLGASWLVNTGSSRSIRGHGRAPVEERVAAVRAEVPQHAGAGRSSPAEGTGPAAGGCDPVAIIRACARGELAEAWLAVEGGGGGPFPDLDRASRVAVARAAWRRGYRASRRGRYDEATRFLGLATRLCGGEYFCDDARYFLARALHRRGDLEGARREYLALLQQARESGSGDYVVDCRRFLRELGAPGAEGVRP